MTKDVRIFCDQCAQDLTETGAMPKHRLELRCDPVPSIGGYVFAVCVTPPISKAKHFCGLPCLRSWVSRESPP